MSRILVIDDETVLRITFTHVLEEHGFDVASAENGREGVEKCREFHPDLVITDLLMPEQDGLATIQILHQDYPKVPIIAMSGLGSATDQKEAIARGALCCVAKPIDGAALIQAVDAAFQSNGA